MNGQSRYYSALGVPPDADEAEIREAYIERAKTHHPDQGGSADRFTQVKEAYEVLSDPERRAEYDRVLSGESGPEISDEAAEQFDRLFNAVSGGPSWVEGWDGQAVHVGVPFDVSCLGGEVTCLGPHGEVNVQVPPQSESGDRAVAQPGDLPATLHVGDSATWERRGPHLHTDLEVSPFRALLGSDVEAPTLTGRTTLTIRPRSPHGVKIRLAGEGAALTGAEGRGNAYYTVRYRLGGPLTDEQRALLSELQNLEVERRGR